MESTRNLVNLPNLNGIPRYNELYLVNCISNGHYISTILVNWLNNIAMFSTMLVIISLDFSTILVNSWFGMDETGLPLSNK